MKKILNVLIILSIFMFLNYNVYATDEKNTDTNTVSSEQTEEEKPTSVKKNETMYVQERCNIRSSYSTDSDRVGGLDAGTEVTVVEEYSNGWYKIEYDSGTAYIKAGILGSTAPENVEENTEGTDNSQSSEENVENQNTEQTAENSDEVDIEYAEILNEVGVLPEVGKNIADYLFFVILSLSVIMVIYMKKQN